MGDLPALSGDLSHLPEDGRVVVGLSGGADSCALAHWLVRTLGPERLLLAHVNHGLRGAEAERDEAFCREFAKRLGVTLQVYRADVSGRAAQTGESIEESGRALRYAFFGSLAPADNDRILTAHTADDNAETVLLNLTRGAGPDGLCGIPPVRGKILRPFLGVHRAETEAYCRAADIAYVTDSSNLSLSFARNRIRQEVLPVLRALNPRAVEAISHAAALQRRERAFLWEEGDRLLQMAEAPEGLLAAPLLHASPSVRDAALKRWLSARFPGRVERSHLEAAERVLLSGGAMTLPGGVQLRRAQGMLFLEAPGTAAPFSLPVGLGENPLPDGRVLTLRIVPLEPGGQNEKINNLLFKCGLDRAIIEKDVRARSRKPGDRFAPAGRGVTKPLKQLFEERRVPLSKRPSAVLLESAGRLVFMEGVGPAEGFSVKPGAKEALLIEIVR